MHFLVKKKTVLCVKNIERLKSPHLIDFNFAYAIIRLILFIFHYCLY